MLKEYRNEIDLIDIEIQALFKKRLEVVKKVKKFKVDNQISVLDSNREQELKAMLKKQYNDDKTWPYYERIIELILSISKEIQNDK